jgi:hypothetical protein
MYYFFFSVHNCFHLVFLSQTYDFIILLTKDSVKKIDPSTSRIGVVMVSVLA